MNLANCEPWYCADSLPYQRGADTGIAAIPGHAVSGLELCNRALAHEMTDMWERIALVEEPDAIRPRT